MIVAISVALAFVVAVLAVLVVGLLRSHAEILRALHDLGVNLEDDDAPSTDSTPSRTVSSSRRAPARVAAGVASPPGEDAPFGPATDITGELPTGGTGRAAVTGVAHSTLLAFLSTGCGTCGTFWDALARPADLALPGPDTRLVIVTNGTDAESAAAVADLAPSGVLTLMSGAAWDDYNVPVSPYFVLVDGSTDQVIGEGAGTSWEQVLDLLSRSVADAGFERARPGPDLTRMGGQDRAEWVDAELRAAGIEPGDPSLYPAPRDPDLLREPGS